MNAAPVLIVMILLGVIGFSFYSSIKVGREVIIEALRRRGMQDINVEHQLFDFDRDTLTFAIACRDADGHRHYNMAKVRYRAFRGGRVDRDDIFWQRPL